MHKILLLSFINLHSDKWNTETNSSNIFQFSLEEILEVYYAWIPPSMNIFLREQRMPNPTFISRSAMVESNWWHSNMQIQEKRKSVFSQFDIRLKKWKKIINKKMKI